MVQKLKKKKKKKRKKSNIHHLFHSPTVTGLLWRIEVSNLSGGLEVSRGDLPCRRCLCMRGVFSCQGCISCSDTHTHTHTHTHTRAYTYTHTYTHGRPLCLCLLKFSDTVDTQTTSTYGIHQSIVLKDPAEHGINYCSYDASAVFCFCFSLNFTLATSTDFVLLQLRVSSL